MLLLKTILPMLVLTVIQAMPPLDYKKNENENPPKYEYQYDIKSDKGVGQGKTEVSDGILASGRYYVEGTNSSQSVEYVADDWGYHPYVEFQNVGPYSQTVTQIAMDKEAMKMLNKKTGKEQESVNVNYIPKEKNEQKQIEENVSVQEPKKEEVEEYTPPANEFNVLPQADYLYLDQNPKLLLQPVLYDDIVPVSQQEEYQNQGQNYEIVPFYENIYKPQKLSYYEHSNEFDSKTVSNNRIKPHSKKLLSRFRDLISGQDVLDINTAVNVDYGGHNQEAPLHPTPIVTEYASENVDSTTTNTVTPTESKERGPIVVEDTEIPLENCKTNLEDQPTVVVTPKPTINAFLAPLTATVKLQQQDSKAVHENYVVDVQKSIPFYLGKIEYYDNAQPKEKNVTATATQHIRLGDFLQQPIPEKPIVRKTPVKNVSNANDVLAQQKDGTKYLAQETKVVEKPVLLTVPIHVEKISYSTQRSVELPVTKYINRHIAIPILVNKPVETPKTTSQLVESKAPVPQYVETPVPVKKVPEAEHKQYPFTVQVPVPVPVAPAFYLPLEIPKPYPIELAKLVIPTHSFQQPLQHYSLSVESAKLTNKNAKRLKNQEPDRFLYPSNLHLQNKVSCIDLRLFGVRKPYCPKINNNHYIGMVPPKIQTPFFYNATSPSVRKQRTARDGFLDNIRWEYGFKPPLIPSLAIDEHGNPVDKHTK